MQRDSLKNSVRLLLVASTIVALLLPLGALSQWTYNNCVVPPQISYTASPNVLLVMDFSGSMQQQTYYPTTGTFSYGGSQALTEGTTVISAPAPPGSGSYDPTQPANYYGLFDTTKYYTYDSTNGVFVPIGTTTASGSANVGIVTVTPGASTAAASGLPASGLSGALLNWALTCREDAALEALIGGKVYDSTDTNANGYVGNGTTKVDCTLSSSSCYKKAQGAHDTFRKPQTSTRCFTSGRTHGPLLRPHLLTQASITLMTPVAGTRTARVPQLPVAHALVHAIPTKISW